MGPTSADIRFPKSFRLETSIAESTSAGSHALGFGLIRTTCEFATCTANAERTKRRKSKACGAQARTYRRDAWRNIGPPLRESEEKCRKDNITGSVFPSNHSDGLLGQQFSR